MESKERENYSVDPRTEADAQIVRALLIVCDAGDADGKIGDPNDRRDYTLDELETLFFALSMALVQLAKVPGGAEAKERFYTGANLELVRRGLSEQ